MATTVHMDYTLRLKQGTSFRMLLRTWDVRMWAICVVYALAYTSNLQKQCLKISVICKHNGADVRTSLPT